MTPTKRWVTVDPGEDTGLSIWEGPSLILGCTLKMGITDLAFYHLFSDSTEYGEFLNAYPEAIDFMEQLRGYELERIVCEDFRLYPWVIYTPDGRATHALDFDQFRTCRLIGAITLVARVNNVPIHLQAAKIKDTAITGGAEQLFYKPLHENRHQNDAIMHGVFYNIIELNEAPRDARI